MISLLTSPDITHTGFKVAAINLNEFMQDSLTMFLNEQQINTNIALYDLKLDSDPIEYVFSVLETCDIVIFNAPNMFYWLTGYVLSLPHCYYLEFDTKTLNTVYKLSLRCIDENSINDVVKNAIQKKYNKAL